MRIFCDGSCLQNPGPGGWAFVCITNDNQVTKYHGHNTETTNNRMELTAAIKSLEKIHEENHTDLVKIYCDSKYVINGITSWIASWKQKNWRGSANKLVKNQDLWLQLDRLNSELNIKWIWIKAHSGIKYNELADSLAKEAALNNVDSNV